MSGASSSTSTMAGELATLTRMPCTSRRLNHSATLGVTEAHECQVAGAVADQTLAYLYVITPNHIAGRWPERRESDILQRLVILLVALPKDGYGEARTLMVSNDTDAGQNTLNWFTENFPDRDRYLPRSSCTCCPCRYNVEWKWFQTNDPDSFDDAVRVDWALRSIPEVKNAIIRKGEAFMRRSWAPPSEIDFDDAPDYDSHMAEECEGLCGI